MCRALKRHSSDLELHLHKDWEKNKTTKVQTLIRRGQDTVAPRVTEDVMQMFLQAERYSPQ